MPKNLLVLKTGTVAPELQLTAGDYDRWFAVAFGAGVRLHVLRLNERAPLPKTAVGYDAVVMTGSSLSLTEPSAWMLRAGELLVESAARGVPVLGVCFGHQLLGHLHGVRTIRNPRGRETGTVEVTLTDAGARDPLFEGMTRVFNAQATHEDIVERVPTGVTVLASNANTQLQAAAFGRLTRSVQFHPELSTGAMSELIRTRAQRLDAEVVRRGAARPGEGARTLHQGVRPSPFGPKLLQNFLRHFT
ncbi:MAG: glutamine amidotransferase-related protein [Myxococcaceae bacterium]